jgi:hypothetical protein
MKNKIAIALTAGVMVAGMGSVSAALVESMSNVVSDGTIIIGENSAVWSTLTGFVTDPNEGLEQDWHQITIASDTSYFYFRYEMNASLPYPDWRYALYLDTDLSRETGFVGGGSQFPIGADYMVQGDTVFSYPQNAGTAWDSASSVGVLDGLWSFYGDYTTIEFAIPKSWIGGTESFNFLLLGTSSDWSEDYYVDSSNQSSGGWLQYTTVPEPGAAVLCGFGVGAMFLRRRRRTA